MTSIRIDWTAVRRLERHLARMVPQAERDAVAVVMRGAMNIKRHWRANAAASAPQHAPHYPRTIGFDVLSLAGRAEAEIGPSKTGRQGALGNLLEYGSVNNPPHNDGGRALMAEPPRFEAQMALVVARGLAWW